MNKERGLPSSEDWIDEISREVNDTSLSIFWTLLWYNPFTPEQMIDILNKRRKNQ